MDPNPSNVIVAPIPQPPQVGLKLNPKLFLALILIVLIVVMALVLFFLSTKNQKQSSQNLGLTTEQKLNQRIKNTFSKKAQIIELANLSLNQKDSQAAYLDYVKLYKELLKNYQQTKNPEAKIIMQDLEVFLRGFKEYKAADFK